MNEELLLYNKLKRMAINLGGTLFGVADVIPYQAYFNLSPEEYQNLHRGISIGVLLSESVLDAITTYPTLLYKWHYRQANNLLDHIAFRVSQFIIQAGYRAVPIPASQVTDWEKHTGHLSHRSMAEKAGLGWRGRNNLLVTQQYGSHVRLVSILTDLPLKPDESMVNKCGRCMKCVHSCPAGALGNHSDDYDINKCYTQLTGYSRLPGIGAHICGICVKSCKGGKGSG
ncbi:MAG: hypothetical protein A2Y71_15855 [Bacteroidetes bacterium RBG_13_42_15]|nr:MAG: hypothetical protein A2Y71_15855 [Bacteroidetes bacterium RBG_13_42_15]